MTNLPMDSGAIGESQLPWPWILTHLERLKYVVETGPARMNKEEREENARP